MKPMTVQKIPPPTHKIKTVLFIPEYWYLSIELFREISLSLGDRVQKVFLDTGDPLFKGVQRTKYSADWLKQFFDITYFLKFPDISKWLINSIFDIYQYKKKVKEILQLNKPDLIITTGDRNHFYSLVRHCCPEVPIIIFQGALVHLKYYTNIGESKAACYKKRFDTRRVYRFFVDWFKIFFYYALFNIPPLSMDHSVGWGLLDNNSYLFLWGSTTGALFKNKKENVFCIGNPLTDLLYNQYFSRTKDNELLYKFGWDISRKVVIVSAPCLKGTADKHDTIQYVGFVIENCPNLNFIVKVHPRDDIEHFEVFSKKENVVLLKDEYTFQELLHISDLNISQYSATSMDAVIYGVPVILLPQKVLNQRDLEYWFGSEIFYKPSTVESCIECIKEALSGSFIEKNKRSRDEFIRNMFSEYAGNSKAATLDKINQLLQ